MLVRCVQEACKLPPLPELPDRPPPFTCNGCLALIASGGAEPREGTKASPRLSCDFVVRELCEQAAEWRAAALDDYEAQLGRGGPGLRAFARKTYDVAANWKLLMENYLEYYHLPAVHPALCNVSGVDEHQRRQGRGMYMCFIAL